MSPSAMEEDLLDLLSTLRSGTVRVAGPEGILALVDADRRTVRMDIQPFVEEWRAFLRAAPKDAADVRDGSHLPKALAEEGWQIDLYNRDKEVARIGRGTSALTGHVHVNLAALGLLREML